MVEDALHLEQTEKRTVFYTGYSADVKSKAGNKEQLTGLLQFTKCFSSGQSERKSFGLDSPYLNNKEESTGERKNKAYFKEQKLKESVLSRKECSESEFESRSQKKSHWDDNQSQDFKKGNYAKPDIHTSESPLKQSLIQKILTSPLLSRAQAKFSRTFSTNEKDSSFEITAGAKFCPFSPKKPQRLKTHEYLDLKENTENVHHIASLRYKDNYSGLISAQHITFNDEGIDFRQKTGSHFKSNLSFQSCDSKEHSLESAHENCQNALICDTLNDSTESQHLHTRQQIESDSKQSHIAKSFPNQPTDLFFCKELQDLKSLPCSRLKKKLLIKCSSKPSEIVSKQQVNSDVPRSQNVSCSNLITLPDTCYKSSNLHEEGDLHCDRQKNSDNVLKNCDGSSYQFKPLQSSQIQPATVYKSLPDLPIDENCNALACYTKVEHLETQCSSSFQSFEKDNLHQKTFNCDSYNLNTNSLKQVTWYEENPDIQNTVYHDIHDTLTDLKGVEESTAKGVKNTFVNNQNYVENNDSQRNANIVDDSLATISNNNNAKDCDGKIHENLKVKLSEKAKSLQNCDNNHLNVETDKDQNHENLKSSHSSFDQISLSEVNNKSPKDLYSLKSVRDSVEKISDVLKVLPSTEVKCEHCSKPTTTCEKTLTSIEKPLKAIKVYLEKLFNKIHKVEKWSANSSNDSENQTITGQVLESTQIRSFHRSDSFDHSDQTFEYQLETGDWTDSLKTLYDDDVPLCLDEDEVLSKNVIMDQEMENSGQHYSGQLLTEKELHQRRIERKRKSESESMTRRESVREWLETLGDGEDVVGDMDKSAGDTGPDVKPELQDHNANFEDDLFLGAEAKLIRTVNSQEQQDKVGEKENLEKKDKLGQLKRSQTLDPPSTPPPLGLLRQRRLSLHKRFQFYHQDSFQSNDSNKTYSSVNEILQERSGNPIEILTNLGFGAKENSDYLAAKIPTRFLKSPSRAEGIKVEAFLEEHPQIQENLDREESLGKPILIGESFMSPGLHSPGIASPVASEQDPPQPEPSTGQRRNSLFSAARNIILMNRFSSSISPLQTDNTQATLHEGITPQGRVFQSILHPDNTEFFANQGLYDDNSEEKKKGKKSLPESKLNVVNGCQETSESNALSKSINLDLDKQKENVVDNNFSKLYPDEDNTLFDQLHRNNNESSSSLIDFTRGKSSCNLASNIDNSSHMYETDMLAFQGPTADPLQNESSSNNVEDFNFESDDAKLVEMGDNNMESSKTDLFESLGPFSKQSSVINDGNYADIMCDNISMEMIHANDNKGSILYDQNSLKNTEQNSASRFLSRYSNPQSLFEYDRLYDGNNLLNSSPIGQEQYNSLYTEQNDLEADVTANESRDTKHKQSNTESSFEKYKRTLRSQSLYPEYIDNKSDYKSNSSNQNENSTVNRRDRLTSARKNWHSSSNFLQNVEAPAPDLPQFPVNPISTIDHSLEPPFPGRLFSSQSMTSLHDWDRYSDAGSSDSSSYIERLHRLKNKHETNRDYQLENTMEQVEKMKRELAKNPGKVDDPKFIQKLQDKYSKGPSYLDKLKNLKAVHERKLYESLSNNTSENHSGNSRWSVDDIRIGSRKPSLLDQLVEEVSSREVTEINDDVFEEYREDPFTRSGSLFSKLSEGDYLEEKVNEDDQITTEEIVGLQDIVLLHGLTDNVLDIIKTHKDSEHSVIKEDEDENQDLSESPTNVTKEIDPSDPDLMSALVSLLDSKNKDDPDLISPVIKEGENKEEDLGNDEQLVEDLLMTTTEPKAPELLIPEVRIAEVSDMGQRRNQLQGQGKNAESFEMEEIQSADIEADSDTISKDLPTIKPPRGPLLRTGSAQSDSSGFADSTDSHSVAEVHWDGLKLKNVESGIETSSNSTDATLVTKGHTDSFSRQSSSTSSNTVTETTYPIGAENSSDLSPQKKSALQESSQERTVGAESSEVVVVGGDGGRKVKMTSSRGHPHSKGTGDYLVEKTGLLQTADPDDLNNAVGEVEIDLYSDGNIISAQENQSELTLFDKGSRKPNNFNSVVEELEVNLYENGLVDINGETVSEKSETESHLTELCEKSETESNFMEPSMKRSTYGKEDDSDDWDNQKSSLKRKIMTSFENILQGVRNDSITSVNLEDDHENDVCKDNMSLPSVDNSTGKTQESIHCESMSSLSQDEKKSLTSEKDVLQKEATLSYDHDDSKVHDDSKYKGHSKNYDVLLDQDDSKGCDDSVTDLDNDKCKDSVSSVSQDEVITYTEEKQLESSSKNEPENSVNIEETGSDSVNTNDDSSSKVGNKKYGFLPKFKFGKKHHKDKDKKDSKKRSTKSDSGTIPTVAGAPKTAQEITNQVTLTYRQHFRLSDEEPEMSEYDMVLGSEIMQQDKPPKLLPQSEVVNYNEIEKKVKDNSVEKTEEKDDSKPVETDSVQVKGTDSEPVEINSVQVKRTDSEPVETDSVQTDSEPVETDSVPVKSTEVLLETNSDNNGYTKTKNKVKKDSSDESSGEDVKSEVVEEVSVIVSDKKLESTYLKEKSFESDSDDDVKIVPKASIVKPGGKYSMKSKENDSYEIPDQNESYVKPCEKESYVKPKGKESYVKPKEKESYVKPGEKETYLMLDDIEVSDNIDKEDMKEIEDKATTDKSKKPWFTRNQDKDKNKIKVKHDSASGDISPKNEFKKDIPEPKTKVKVPPPVPKKPHVSKLKHTKFSQSEQTPSHIDTNSEQSSPSSQKPIFKKGWFTSRKGSEDSFPKEPKSSKQVDSLTEALKKNSDVVFKATLSPFRRVWTSEEHKAESVEEPSLKKQMSQSVDDEEIGVIKATNSFSSLPRSENANECSLAEEMSGYSSNDDDKSVDEQDIMPVVVTKKPESGNKFVSFDKEKDSETDQHDYYSDEDQQSEYSIGSETEQEHVLEEEEGFEIDKSDDANEVTEEIVSPVNSDRKLESMKRQATLDKQWESLDKADDSTAQEEAKVLEHQLQSLESHKEAVLPAHLKELKMDVITQEIKADFEKELRDLLALDESEQQQKQQPSLKFVDKEEIPPQFSRESSFSIDEVSSEQEEEPRTNNTLESLPKNKDPKVASSSEPEEVDNFDQIFHEELPNEQMVVIEPNMGKSSYVPDYNDNKIMNPTDMNDNNVGFNNSSYLHEEPVVHGEIPSRNLCKSDSILDKFFDNPNFQTPSDESEEEEVSHSSRSIHFENPNFVNDDDRRSSQDSLHNIDTMLDFADNENVDLSPLKMEPVSQGTLLSDSMTENKDEKTAKRGSFSSDDYDRSSASSQDFTSDDELMQADANLPIMDEDEIAPQVKQISEKSIDDSDLFKDKFEPFEKLSSVSGTSKKAKSGVTLSKNKSKEVDEKSVDLSHDNGTQPERHGSIESSRIRSGTDDKCVGTDLDLSGLNESRASIQSSLDHSHGLSESRSSLDSTMEFSQRMVVSKLSMDPKKQQVPVNDIAEVVLIIDNGEIKAIQSVENNTSFSSPNVSAKYETYELVSDKPFHSYHDTSLHHNKELPYSDNGSPNDYGILQTSTPPLYNQGSGGVETRRGRMSRDSGYNSNFTSISDNQYGADRQSASLNLKVSPSQHGASYIPVIRDYSVRPKEYDHFGQHLHSGEGLHDSSWSVASGSSDVSEHQVLCTMLKQSEYYGPQIEGILQKSQWPLFSRTRACTKQNLVEEVKLMQHALQKYKMEFKALEIRSRNVYKENLQHLTEEERDALGSLEDIRDEILNEIVDLEKALAVRMKNIIAGTDLLNEQGPLDLASLHVISNMIEVLKEQVYHSNIVNSMCDPDSNNTHPLLQELENTSQDHHDSVGMKRSSSLLDHLTLLQSQMQAQQSQQTAVLNSSLRDLKSVLLEEIRNSIQSETQELKCKLENTESQLHELKQQISRSGTPHDLSHELIMVDIEANQNEHSGEDETF